MLPAKTIFPSIASDVSANASLMAYGISVILQIYMILHVSFFFHLLCEIFRNKGDWAGDVEAVGSIWWKGLEGDWHRDAYLGEVCFQGVGFDVEPYGEAGESREVVAKSYTLVVGCFNFLG